ncbi:MAG TPA: PIN domain-containing protein [Sphingomicrobium sp.]|nr:PIN domain-containing protein [Sphingomicrobium sp.]
MPILLDTSVAIAILDGAAPVTESKRNEGEAAFLSIISRVELTPGIYSDGQRNHSRASRLESFLREVELLPFSDAEADAYEEIIARSGFSRRLVIDRMIAATALANGLLLATLNERDFRNIPGLTIENWSV